jgi:polyisoprenoid-binding protein YceI
MLHRRIAAALLVALTSALLAACGAATTTTPAPTAAPAASTVAPAAAVPTEAPAAAPTAAPAGTDDYGYGTGATATEAPAAATAAPAAAPTTAPAAAADTGAMRTFRIVPEESEASYAVQEVFLRQNLPFRAVGKTSAVEGEFQFTAGGTPTGEVSQVTVDLSTLTSDDERRDNRIRSEWLESAKFPIATFVSTGVEGVPASYTEGEEITFTLLGDMTIRDVTKPVAFNVTGTLEGDTVTGTAVANIKMTDFGFQPPDIAGFVTVEDDVEVSITFTAREAS